MRVLEQLLRDDELRAPVLRYLRHTHNLPHRLLVSVVARYGYA